MTGRTLWFRVACDTGTYRYIVTNDRQDVVVPCSMSRRVPARQTDAMSTSVYQLRRRAANDVIKRVT